LRGEMPEIRGQKQERGSFPPEEEKRFNRRVGDFEEVSKK